MRQFFTCTAVLILLLLVSACAAPTPSSEQADEELLRLRQEQRDMAQELQTLREEMARLRGEPLPPTDRETAERMPPSPEGDFAVPSEQVGGAEQFRRAFLDFSTGRYAQAAEGFRGFIEQNPESPFRLGAYYWLGHSFAGLGQPEKAVLNFEQLLWEAPQNSRAPAVLVHMMTLYQRMNQPEKAEEARATLQSRYPDSPETRRAMKMTIQPAQETIEGKQ